MTPKRQPVTDDLVWCVGCENYHLPGQHDDSPPEGAAAKEPVGPRASIRPHDDGDEIKPWDDDHTALVHVLWHCHHAGLTLKDDFDEIASQIRQSKYHRAVVAAAAGPSCPPAFRPDQT